MFRRRGHGSFLVRQSRASRYGVRNCLCASATGIREVILPHRCYASDSTAASGGSQLPQQTDLLDVYRGLAATGRIKYDEDQVRVVMQVRINAIFLLFRNP